jgi:hypothetical protein
MTKRKISDSQTKTKHKLPPSNPFLNYFRDSHQEESDDTFQNVLSFIELTKQKGGDCNLLSDSVNELLTFLDTEKVTPEDTTATTVPDVSKRSRGLISNSDVASLLLPWAIKNILHSSASEDQSEKDLQWRTLETCLNSLLSSDSDHVSNVLSLSVLHKLVPTAAKVAFLNITNVSTIAGKCYCLLVDRIYRPPFDLICDSLLPIMGENVQDSITTIRAEDHHHHHVLLQSIVVSTLRLLHTMLKKANPKKSFQILIRPKTFFALSDIHACATISEWSSEDPRPLVKMLLVD